MTSNDYIEKCRLSMENYLALEKEFFQLANTVYIWDNWNNKKDFSNLVLANLLTNTCIGIEDSLKLLFQNPLNNLNKNIIDYLNGKKSKRKRDAELISELKKNNYENLGIVNMLDYDNFRKKLNEIAKIVRYDKPPFEIVFDKIFGSNDKPIWFQNYEDVKHNLFTNYKKAKFNIVIDALAAYYIICKVISHESCYLEARGLFKKENYFSWYCGKFKLFSGLFLTDSMNGLFRFKSEYFNNIECKNEK